MEKFNQKRDQLYTSTDESVKTTVGSYVPYKKVGQVLYISGQLAWQDKKLLQGKIGLNTTLEQGIFAARACAQQVIHQLNLACNQNLKLIKECIALKGYVNCTPEFTEISEVINGASDAIVALLGISGKHTRVAIGVCSLPKGSIVEIEAIFKLKKTQPE